MSQAENLIGPELDMEVAKCLGMTMRDVDDLDYPDDEYWVIENGVIYHYTEIESYSRNRKYTKSVFSPSTKWSQAGEILDKYPFCIKASVKWDESIGLTGDWVDCYEADILDGTLDGCKTSGDTMLIAAMRSFVKLHYKRVK